MSKIGKAMDRVFSPTGSVMGFLGRVGDVLLAGVLWLVCSLPVVTIGAATAALYDVMFRILEGKEDALFRDFFGAFRRRFGFLTGLWLAMLALGAFFVLDLYFYYLWSAAEAWMGTVLFALFAAATTAYLCMMAYLIPYAGRTELKFRTTLKNAFYISVRHLPVTLLMLVINGALVVLCLNFIILLVALPGLMGCADALCMRKLMDRYAPLPEEEDET